MKTNQATGLNVLLYPEKAGEKSLWIAQSIGLDFAAQGATIKEAQSNFVGTINAHIAICLKNGETPFENVPSAPAWFRHEFQMIPKESIEVESKPSHSRMFFKHALPAAA